MSKIILTFPPSVNHMYFTARNGQRIIKKDGKIWITSSRQLVEDLIDKPYDRLTSLTIRFYWPTLRKADADNRLKCILDVLAGTLVEDDRWTCIPEVHLFSELDRDSPRIEVSYIAP